MLAELLVEAQPVPDDLVVLQVRVQEDGGAALRGLDQGVRPPAAQHHCEEQPAPVLQHSTVLISQRTPALVSIRQRSEL